MIATTSDFDQVLQFMQTFPFHIARNIDHYFSGELFRKKTCPRQISDTIPNVTSSLRNIWLLSKCFNTDLKIHNLILMISQLINERVVNAIQLIEFKNPASLQVDTGLVFLFEYFQEVLKNCVTVLERWKKNFLKTRMEIELSRKEKRWEFDINLIFADTDHINNICKDMILICKILMEIKNCFGEEMKKITTKPKFLDSAIKKIEGTTQGKDLVIFFSQMTYQLSMQDFLR